MSDPFEPNANDVRDTVRRFEAMLASQDSVFFDLSDFELLIDHYTSEHQYERALRACEAALLQYPFSHDLLIDKAQLLAMTGNTPAALRLIDEVAELEPGNPDVPVTRGLIYTQQGDFSMAIDHFKQGLLIGPNDRDDVHFNIALAYQNWGKFRAAVKHYREALRLNPDNDAAVLELVTCLEAADELATGAEFLQEAVDADPFAARAWYNLGLLRFRTEEYEKAQAAFEYATLIDGEFHGAYAYLGQALVMQGLYEPAFNAFSASFPAGAPTSEALCNMGECQEKQGQWLEARQFYQQALTLAPDTDEAWFGLGMVLSGQERWYEALHYIRKALDFYDQSAEYWLGLAQAEYQVGNVVSALEAFEQVTVLEPDNRAGWLGWSAVLYEQGHYEEAAALLRQAQESHPEDAELYYRTCVYLCRLFFGRR